MLVFSSSSRRSHWLVFMLLSQDCHLAASNGKMPLSSDVLKCERTCVLRYLADVPCLFWPLFECLEMLTRRGKEAFGDFL